MSESENPTAPDTTIEYNTDNFVAAVYLKKMVHRQKLFYPMMTKVDYFYEKSKNTYRLPCPEDKIWINDNDILTQISEPLPTGKSRRMFKISEEDMDKNQVMYEKKTRTK